MWHGCSTLCSAATTSAHRCAQEWLTYAVGIVARTVQCVRAFPLIVRQGATDMFATIIIALHAALAAGLIR